MLEVCRDSQLESCVSTHSDAKFFQFFFKLVPSHN